MKRIAILASGSGTNAENLINYFNQQSERKMLSCGQNSLIFSIPQLPNHPFTQ